jgi:hypothetical protein
MNLHVLKPDAHHTAIGGARDIGFDVIHRAHPANG